MHKHRTDTRSRHWMTSPEFPQPEELMAEDSAALPAGPSDEEPFDKNAYLEFQYALNRFEGTELLRRAVTDFRKRPLKQDSDAFHVYTQVHVQGYLLAKSGPACRISFSTECSETKVIWRQTSRLTAGTLIALSPRSDNFNKQCFVAVVAARYLLGGLEPNFEDGEDENTPPRIEIFWSNVETAVFDPSVELVMLEAKGGYFETVRHAMIGLQHAAKFKSKFDKYITDGSNKECRAAYLTADDVAVPERAKQFDSSQMEAFNRMTSSELAVIQGPPGTGKTFTSVVALESYVRTLKAVQGGETIRPVIVAAQTNHALDQLLDRCLSFNAVIARLGGRTENEHIEARTLFNIRKESKIARGPTRGENSRKKIQSEIEDLLKGCFPAELIAAEEFLHEELISEKQYESLNDEEYDTVPMTGGNGRNDDDESVDSIKQWLGGCVEYDQTYVYRPPKGQKEPAEIQENAIDESKQDNDKERLYGDFFPTKYYMTGSVPSRHGDGDAISSQASRLLLKHQDLYEIKLTLRGTVYRLLRRRLVNARAKRFPKLLKAYQAACDEIKIARLGNDVKILTKEKIEILGCTTTGLTKYRGLIAALKPQVLMVEEAAETREANITSALYPSLDQIILVGDHQQLVPQVDNRELGYEPYNMHVSLFERLVDLRLPYAMLQVQRRMVPAIRQVVNTFYHKLTDHVSVTDPRNRARVLGMGNKSLWWFHHDWEESRNPDDFAYSNFHEANMIVCFVRYLVQNGVHPDRITMLSFYKGQVNLLLETLRRDPTLSAKNPTKEWSVKTVDGFQGEENDIIILSIVRSARPGFVQNKNRAVVALSRAKCGLYIFGNVWNLLRIGTESLETWLKVYEVFQEQELIDNFLPVTCENHGRETKILSIEDWDTITAAGCDEPCTEECPKGHPCTKNCHPFKQSEIICQERCERILSCGHECNSLCGEPCHCIKRCDEAPAHSTSVQTSRSLTNRTLIPPLRPARPAQAHETKGFQSSRAGRGGRPTKRNRGERGATGRLGPSPADSLISKRSLDSAQSIFKGRALCDNTRVPLGQVFGVAEADAHVPTVEQLMETGYYSKREPSHDREHPTVHAQDNFESATVSSVTNSLSDRWSPEKISQKDRALAEEAKQVAQQGSLYPTTIKTNFRRTTVEADGSRRYGLRTISSRTIPKFSATRKEMLHDAAAGRCIIDPLQKDEQRAASLGRMLTGSEGSDVEDLICFD
ncbi:hypothetical protein FLONG3_10487 [Fusarium longipes]|uniref:Helicase required for rnai-mediated heterochromatin assembly 1 n=1 Tax=Fusarium longipes TaxID=694270 RepID=A0A395RN09_9HYPO|nr:hypothetical protein FLONG3_10487 [Fusarium longipes]